MAQHNARSEFMLDPVRSGGYSSIKNATGPMHRGVYFHKQGLGHDYPQVHFDQGSTACFADPHHQAPPYQGWAKQSGLG